MSDRFETVMQDIAIRAATNGGPTTADVLTALQAAHSDDLAGRAELTALMAQHVADDKHRAQIQAEECAKKHADLFCREPRRTGGGSVIDDPDDDYSTPDNRKQYAPEFEAASESRKKYSREQIVASFWILVGLLVLSQVVNGLVDLLFKR